MEHAILNHSGPSPPELAVGHPVLFLSPPSDDLSLQEVPCVLSKYDLGGISPEVADTCSSLSESWDEHKSVRPTGALTPINSRVSTLRGTTPSYQRMFFQKIFFEGKQCKILFSNPGIFVKNVDNPLRNFVGKKDLNPVVTVATLTPTPRVCQTPPGQESPFPSLEAPSCRPSSSTSFELSAFCVYVCFLFSFFFFFNQFLSSTG